MHDVINQILEKTKADLEQRKKVVSLEKLKQSVKKSLIPSLFESAIAAPRKGDIALIAEIKLATPTEPNLGKPEEISKRAKEYEEAGVDGISVVVEKHFFKGDPAYVGEVKLVTTLPVLQKDFIIDPYQIYEAVDTRADAILFIARLVTQEQLIEFVDLAYALGMVPVVEVHNDEDLEKAVTTAASIIGVNARDLDTMEVNVDRACELLQKVPDEFTKLGFSGVVTKAEVEKYREAGAEGVLVGTTVMKSAHVKGFLGGLRDQS